MLKRFYPDFNIPEDITWKKGVSPATLQGLVIENRYNPEKVLDQIAEKVYNGDELEENIVLEERLENIKESIKEAEKVVGHR